MRAPKQPFVCQFKNKKRKASFLCPNGHSFPKTKTKNEKQHLNHFQ